MSPVVRSIIEAVLEFGPRIYRAARRPALERRLHDARGNYARARTAEERLRFRNEVDALVAELLK
jgi:hypothetical protein